MKPFFPVAPIAATVISLSTVLSGVSYAQQTPAPTPPRPTPPVPGQPMMPPPAPPAPPVKLPAGVAARVGGKDITFAELSAKLQAWSGRPLLQQVVQSTVIEQEAKKQGVSVTPAELKAEVAKVKQQQIEQQTMRGAMMTWNQIAQKEGISDAFVADNVRLGLLARKAYAKAIESQVPGLDGQLKVAHILIPSVDLEQPKPDAKPKTPEEEKKMDEDAKAKADQVLADIKAGKITFADAAKQFSADKGPDGQGSATNGGELPYTSPERWDPAFAAGAKALAKPGDMTETPVKSRYGYHIIKLISKGSDAPASEKAAFKKQQIDQQMQNPQGIGMWIQYLMSKATVNYNIAPAKPAAKPAAKPKK